MRVQIKRFAHDYAVVHDERSTPWILPAENVDADRRVVADAWRELLLGFGSRWFDVQPEGTGRVVSLRPSVAVNLPSEAGGEPRPGTWVGWSHRGRANWKVIKHVLHGKTLQKHLVSTHVRRSPEHPSGVANRPDPWTAENWPTDPGRLTETLEAIDKATGCGIPEWISGPVPACDGCPVMRRATCRAVLDEGSAMLVSGTARALTGADLPAEVRGDLVHCTSGDGVRAIVHTAGRDIWWSVTSYQILPRRAAISQTRERVLEMVRLMVGGGE